MSFNGKRSGVASVQYSKGIMATLCREILLSKEAATNVDFPEGADTRAKRWYAWIGEESRRRLIYAIWCK